MILLNQPYSVYERQLDQARRREAARRAINLIIWCGAMMLLGLALGYCLRAL